MCALALLCVGTAGQFPPPPVLEGESAEEQQEGWLELPPCAHLPKWDSGGPSLQPALCGVTLPARAPPEHTAPFCPISEADSGCRGSWGCINPKMGQMPNGTWPPPPASAAHKGLHSHLGIPRMWFIFPHFFSLYLSFVS